MGEGIGGSCGGVEHKMVEESFVVVLYLVLQQPAAVGGQKGSRGCC